MENKKMFVQALQAAFVAGDPERYGHLSSNPVRYEVSEVSHSEWLMRSMNLATGVDFDPVLITGCSCSAIAEEFIKHFL